MSEKTDTITLNLAEYEALIARVEDAEDLAAVAAAEAREAVLGKDRAHADYLPIELVAAPQRRRASGTRLARSTAGSPARRWPPPPGSHRAI